MCDESELLLKRAQRYAKSNSIQVLGKDRLGYGSDGTVWKSSRPSAVKALYYAKNYSNEVECYRRLKAANVRQIGEFNVPMLDAFSDELLVIEMSIVESPYLLDFGKVYLDRPPDYFYDKQLKANTYAEWRERFGAAWTDVASAMRRLQDYGIYYVDPRPSNINTGIEDDDWELPEVMPPADIDDFDND